MTHASFEPCPSANTVRRIATARWTPYVAATLQTWCRTALSEPGACINSRAGECKACHALQKIAALHWNEALGERIQQIAREAAGMSHMRSAVVHPMKYASF